MKARGKKPTENFFESMVLHEEACFLCGRHLRGKGSREHVFPRWLQHKHDLWNQGLILLNRTFIKYRNLVIPCCKKCNNEHLSKLESTVEAAFRTGYKAAKNLSPLILYQWAGKIFYGILRKELQLYTDRKNKESGTIVPPDLIEKFWSLHFFLQSIRRPFTFPKREPFSTLVVNLHHGVKLGTYDFRDRLHLMVVGICSNDVGVIVALEDGGLNNDTYGRYIKDVKGRKLLPIQFDELFAKVLYNVSRLTRVPKFVTIAGDSPEEPAQVFMLPLAGYSRLPVVRDWNQEEYAHCLAAVLSNGATPLKIDELFVPPEKVRSWMEDEAGKLVFLEKTAKENSVR